VATRVTGERGPVDASLTLTERRTEQRISHTATRSIRGDHVTERPANACDHLGERREVRRVVFGDEHVHVLGWQTIPSLVRRRGRVLDGE
jgi:hypothetical protein